ncbi:MAG: SBBP repeat-containing protein [Gammaproteobacteria bacterium]|nr:SBBP repeat-containing protein [Gammaproteobacteria bacterium]
MKAVKFFHGIFLMVIFLVLAGCGGGGGGDKPEDQNYQAQFGDVLVGATKEHAIQMMSIGEKGMNVNVLPTLPPPFSIVQDNCSSRAVPSGSSCTFTILFAPTAAGPFSHSFDFPSDAANKTTVNMSGTGIANTVLPPAAPTGVSATPGNGQVTVLWNTVSGASAYNLYWSTGSGNASLIANVTSPYVHTGRTNGVEYRYVVTAKNASGESDPSVWVSATPLGASPPPTAGWTGTKQFGTAGDDEAKSITVDASGNVYVAGETWGGLNYAGGGDVFVVKFNAAGVEQWNLQFGTVALDQAFGVAVDAAGNVYVVGRTYGGLHGNTYAGGDGDAFVVKYNTEGVRQWTKQIGTTGGDSINGVAADVNGNVYVAGGAGGSLNGNTYAGGDADAFVAKYDALGDEQWLRQFGAGGRDVASSVAVDAGGNVHVVGEVTGSLHGRAYVGGVYDAFVAKYDATGTWLWTDVFGARVGVFGTSNTDVARSVAVDTNGNVYVGGWTTGALDGDTTVGNHALGSMGDGFVVKYDATGTSQWIRQFGTGFTDAVHGVAVDAVGSLYLAGVTGHSLGGNRNAGFDDAFVMKYDAAGVRQWTRQPGTPLGDYAYGVAVSGTGHVFAAGATKGGLNGNANAGGVNFDAFVVKYDAGGGG